MGLGPNRAAAEQVVASLRAAGAVEDRDEALLAAFLSCASDLDGCGSNMALSALHREYRGYLADVREVGAGGVDDDTAQFLESVRTPLGNTSDAKPKDVRPSDHRRCGADGVSVDAVAAAGGSRRRRARS
jgi:hypothetical protein